MINGMAQQAEGANPIEVSGKLQVELIDLESQSPEDVLKTVGKVLDTIKDAGGGLGPSSNEAMMAMRYGRMPSGSNVKFVLRDFKRLREQAYEQAVADARARGVRLARLSGVKLGQVVAVQEVQVAGDPAEPSAPKQVWYWMETQEAPRDPDEIAVEALGDVPVSVRLTVRFEIAGADAAAQSGASK
jgi:hypothetical protein